MSLSADYRLDILDVIAGANWEADAKDVEALANHAPDDFITGAFEARPGKRFRDDLRVIFEGEGRLKRHVLANPVIEGDGDRARAMWMMPVFEGENAPALIATCKVTEEMRWEGGRWLIAPHAVESNPSMRADVGQRR